MIVRNKPNCGNKWRLSKWEPTELATAGEPDTISEFAEMRKQTESGKALQLRKGKTFCVLWLEAVARGKLEAGWLESGGIWCDWFREYIWLFGLVLLGEARWLKPPTLAGHQSNYLHELFYDRRSWWGTGRVWARSKGDTTCPTTSQNPSLWHPSWLNKACTTRKDSESDDWLKTTRKLIPSP